MKTPKILTLDIETSPLESFTWGTFDQNVGVEQIKTEWSVLSFAAKWLGKPKVIYADTSGRGVDKIRDDGDLLDQLWRLLDEADIVVAQNGVSFDLKKINARMLMAGQGPYSPVRVIDTLRAAKQHFKFTSNKLAWLSKHLTDAPKSLHNKYPGFELWSECLLDNPTAWAEMKKYNKQDVIATEKLYLKLRPWITQHPNLATYSMREDLTCPKCDSPELQARGYTVTQSGKYQRLHCQKCGGWSRSKTNLIPANTRKGKAT